MALSKEQLAKEMQTEICELRQVLETYRPGEEAEGVFGQKEVKFPKRLCIGKYIFHLKFALFSSNSSRYCSFITQIIDHRRDSM